MIAKGTKVHITTTNGGELVANLLDHYHPTYDAVVGTADHYIIILPNRLKSIKVA